MLRQTLLPVLAATVVALGSPSKANAWGAYHAGYTHVGPSGVQHWGHTGAVGPYGAYSGGRSFGTAGGYRYGSGYHYGGSAYGGYHYGGFGGASLYGGAYRAGYYRRW
jgi:hypothetical protein